MMWFGEKGGVVSERVSNCLQQDPEQGNYLGTTNPEGPSTQIVGFWVPKSIL